MPRVVPEYREQARRKIVLAARKVFWAKGYRKIRMEDVAREAGVSKGAIYLYFPNKVALIRAIQESTRQDVAARLAPLQNATDVAAGLVGLLTEFGVDDVDPSLFFGLLADAYTDPRLRAVMQEDHEEDLASLRALLRDLKAKGRIPLVKDTDTAAYVVIALFQASIYEQLLVKDPASVRRALTKAMRFVLGE
jgi:AcrR family transcriptional regulator